MPCTESFLFQSSHTCTRGGTATCIWIKWFQETEVLLSSQTLTYTEQNKSMFEVFIFYSLNAKFNNQEAKERFVKAEQTYCIAFFFSPSTFLPLFLWDTWEQISLQTAKAPKWSRSNLSAPFFLFRAPPLLTTTTTTPPLPPLLLPKTLPTKGCLSARNFPHSLQRQTFFPSANSP